MSLWDIFRSLSPLNFAWNYFDFLLYFLWFVYCLFLGFLRFVFCFVGLPTIISCFRMLNFRSHILLFSFSLTLLAFSFLFLYFLFFHHFPDVWFCAFRFCWVWLTVHLPYCSLLRIPRPARHPAAQVRPSPKYIQIAILEPKNRWLVEPSSGTVSITAPPLAWQNVCFIHSSRPPTIYVLVSFNDWLFTATLTDRFLSWWGAEVGRCTPCFVV